MIMGNPSVRKSAAIKIGQRLLKKTNYNKLAPDRMSRQSFLEELYRMNQVPAEDELDAILDNTIEDVRGQPSEMTIHAGEFIDYIGQNDKDYLMLLTNLYDNLDSYSNPKVTRNSASVSRPTVNMLAASTPENLNMAFPQNMMDTGTMSRLLFIYSPPVGTKILFPSGSTSPEAEASALAWLKAIEGFQGDAKVSPEAEQVLEAIYSEAKPVDDPRLSFFHSRRLIHLLKISMLVSATKLEHTISADTVLEANTYLCSAEVLMPKALGNFGISRTSNIVHAMLSYIEMRGQPPTIAELYGVFANDFNKNLDFQNTITDMFNSKKLSMVRSVTNPDRLELYATEQPIPDWAHDYIIPDYLTQQEKDLIGV